MNTLSRSCLLAALVWTVTPASAKSQHIGWLDVHGPATEAGTYVTGVADEFHAPTPPPEGFGPFPLVRARSRPTPNTTPEQGCAGYENAAEVEGKVALVRDGGACTMISKYFAAIGAGAVGILIHADEPVGAEDDSTLRTIIWAPDTYVFFYGLYITRYRGERLRAALAAGEAVTVTPRSEPPVASEPPPPDGAALALAAWPNPSGAGPVAVRLSLASPAASARVWVVDALGREVAVLHDGSAPAGPLVLSADATGWAPGVYVVRATAGDDAGTARLTVVP